MNDLQLLEEIGEVLRSTQFFIRNDLPLPEPEKNRHRKLLYDVTVQLRRLKAKEDIL